MTSNIASNSSTTPLPADTAFFGFWTSVGNFSAVNALVNADVPGEVFIQFSTTRQNVDFEVSIPVSAGETQTLSQTILAPYFRVKYANSSDTQTSFLLWTTLSSAYPTEVAVAVDLDANTSSVSVFGEKPDTTKSALQLDDDGNLKTTATLSVEGTLNVYDASAVAQMTIETDRILYDTDIIANTLYDICGNTDSMITQLEYINGYLDAGLSVSVSNAELAVRDASAIEQMTIETDRLLYDLDIIANRLYDISGSVSVSNQITGFATSDKQDSMLSDLDEIVNRLHDISGAVEITNFPELQMTKDASAIEQLQLVNFNLEDIALKYLFKPATQPAQVDFDTYASSLAQGSTWSVPADGQDGWAFNKTLLAGATLYTYANSTLAPNGQEDDITLGSIFSMFFVANYPLVFNSSENKQFYLTIYTKPTGSGDAGAFYKSRKTYVMPSSTIVSKGGDRFYWVEHENTNIRPDLEHIEYQLAVQEGTCADSEIVQFIALQVDSAVPVGQFSGIVKMAGFQSALNTIKIVEFGNYSRKLVATNNLKSLVVSSGQLAVKDASAVALLAQIADGITVQVGEVDISGVNVVDEKLSVLDVSANSHLEAIEDILDNGFVNVYDASAVSILTQIKDNGISVTIADTVAVTGDFYQATQPVSIAESVAVTGDFYQATQPVSIAESVAVTGDFYQATQPVSIAESVAVTGDFYQATQPVSIAESVAVTIADSVAVTGDFYQATQPVSIADSVAVTGDFYQATQPVSIADSVAVTGEFYQATQPVSIADSVAVTIADSVAVTGDFYQATQPVSIADSVAVTGDFYQATQPVSIADSVAVTGDFYQATQPVSIADSVAVTGDFYQATQPVSIAEIVDVSGNVNITNASLDVHAYASSNGTNWHHLSSDANGQLNVHSKTQDGAGNDITSTAVSGTETYTALDVKCRGTTSVSGSVTANVATENGNLTSTLSGSGNSVNSLDVAVRNTPSVKAVQYGSFGNLANNVASILPAGTTAGIDVADWSYFLGYYEDYYSGMFPTGQLRLQYSFDNITYYNFFNTQVSPGGGTPRTANITKQDIPGINWIRFLNDTNQTMISVTITLFGASL